MKLAVRIAKNDVNDDAYVVLRGFESSIRKAAELGYDGVELALGHSSDIDFDRTEKLLQQNNLEVSCLTTGQIFTKYHLYLTNPDRILRQRAIDTFYDLVDIAERFGTMINMGRVRGFYSDGQTAEQAEALFIDALSYIVDKAAKKNVPVIVEPLNRYETNFINNARQCADLLRWLAPEYCGIMLDLFHMNLEEVRLGQTFVDFGSQIKYVQFADSNKLAPGWGHIDFDDVFDGMHRAGYDGWCGVEVLAKPSADEAASQAISFLRRYVPAERVRCAAYQGERL